MYSVGPEDYLCQNVMCNGYIKKKNRSKQNTWQNVNVSRKRDRACVRVDYENVKNKIL